MCVDDVDCCRSLEMQMPGIEENAGHRRDHGTRFERNWCVAIRLLPAAGHTQLDIGNCSLGIHFGAFTISLKSF